LKISKLENEEEVTRNALEEVINFAKVSNFGKVCAVKSDTLEGSEENEILQKEAEGNFGEKRLLGEWG